MIPFLEHEKTVKQIAEQIANDQEVYFNWRDTCKPQKAALIEYFDNILANTHNYEELVSKVSETDFLNNYSKLDEFSYLILASFIYRTEISSHEAPTILERCHSVDEITRYLIQLKFHIWRIETNTASSDNASSDNTSDNDASGDNTFDNDSYDNITFADFIRRTQTDLSTILCMLDACAINAEFCAIYIAQTLLESGNKRTHSDIDSAALHSSIDFEAFSQKLIQYALRKKPDLDISAVLTQHNE